MEQYQTLGLLIPPLLGSLILFMLRQTKAETLKWVSFFIALFTFSHTAYLLTQFNPQGGVQFEFNMIWIMTANINFHIGIDGISMPLVLLTTLLCPLIILTAREVRHAHAFFGLILLMESALIGVFVARDAFLYYLFWEAALIPVYFLSAVWGGENRIKVTFKFFLYTVFGSLFMLVGLVFLYVLAKSSDYAAFSALKLPLEIQRYLFWGLFVAFAIKMPIFPFHTWQPDTYTESPTPATMLLSGIMLKMGVYSLFRWLLPIVPLAVLEVQTLIIVLSVIGIVYGGIIAIQQKDIKRLIAYSSFSHVGLMAAGVFCLSEFGFQGTMIQMLAHGINVVGLFYVIDIIQNRTNTRDIKNLGGITQTAPALTIYFTILMLGSVALPLTNGFVGEFMLLRAVFDKNVYLGAVAGLTIIFGAVYMLRMYQGVMFGEKTSHTENVKDVTFQESMVLLPLTILVFVMGIFPNLFLNLSSPAVAELLKILK